jgi:hypothetical protein
VCHVQDKKTRYGDGLSGLPSRVFTPARIKRTTKLDEEEKRCTGTGKALFSLVRVMRREEQLSFLEICLDEVWGCLVAHMAKI